MTCTGNHTVTQAEMDAGGTLTNVVTVTSSAPTVTDTLSIPIQQSPKLTVKKSSTTASITAAGQVVPYSYLVTNTGNVTVTNISASDNKTPSVNCPSTSLAVGASMTCTATHTATQGELDAGGNVTNIVTVTSSAPTVTDTLSIPVQQSPKLAVKKSPTPPAIKPAGQVVPYSYLVTNTGNVTVTNISASDN